MSPVKRLPLLALCIRRSAMGSLVRWSSPVVGLRCSVKHQTLPWLRTTGISIFLNFFLSNFDLIGSLWGDCDPDGNRENSAPAMNAPARVPPIFFITSRDPHDVTLLWSRSDNKMLDLTMRYFFLA